MNSPLCRQTESSAKPFAIRIELRMKRRRFIWQSALPLSSRGHEASRRNGSGSSYILKRYLTHPDLARGLFQSRRRARQTPISAAQEGEALRQAPLLARFPVALKNFFERAQIRCYCRRRWRLSQVPISYIHDSKMITHEEMCSRIVSAVPDGIWVVDPQGQTIFNNKRMAEILVADTESLAGQSCFECVFPEDLPEAQHHFALGMAGNRQPFDFRLRRNDGSETWVSISCGPVCDASGSVVSLLGVFAEITERKLAEAKIRESEARFHIMANCAPVLIWMAGHDKLCEFFNQGWLAFTGRHLEQEIGNGWAQGVHPDDTQHCLEVYHSAFEARQPFEMEYRLRRHDGEYRWILDTGAPRFAPDARFMGYVGTAVDITDKKRAAESSSRLEHLQRLAVMGELAATIVHELTQPLTAISTNVDSASNLLNSPSPRLNELAEIISDIRADGARAREVIGRIRNFVLKRETLREPLDLNSLIANTLDLLAGDARRRNIQVRAELAPGIPLAIGDRTQLQQVLINLALNGMEAMADTPRAARCLTVQTRRHGGDHIEVAVVDRGVGVAVDQLPNLFEPFFSTKMEGMGLGLFLARSIVDSHRGRIWAENNPRSGATFRFTVLLDRSPSLA
jgi:PAS domain S-box-containing protein